MTLLAFALTGVVVVALAAAASLSVAFFVAFEWLAKRYRLKADLLRAFHRMMLERRAS
jgi:hypothetical protein